MVYLTIIDCKLQEQKSSRVRSEQSADMSCDMFSM